MTFKTGNNGLVTQPKRLREGFWYEDLCLSLQDPPWENVEQCPGIILLTICTHINQCPYYMLETAKTLVDSFFSDVHQISPVPIH